MTLPEDNIPVWIYADTGEPTDPTASRDTAVEASLVVLPESCGRSTRSDLFVEPGITHKGRLVIRALGMLEGKKTKRVDQLKMEWKDLPFKQAAEST